MKICHSNSNQKAGEPLLLSDRLDFRAKRIFRRKKTYYIVIKGSFFQEDITILNKYAYINRASKGITKRLKEMKPAI